MLLVVTVAMLGPKFIYNQVDLFLKSKEAKMCSGVLQL